jgi:hypothetical protein
MNKYLFLNYIQILIKEYIFIFFASTIFFFISATNVLSEENVFIINSTEVKGKIKINFSREKYLDKAFSDSFQTLMKKILLTRDLRKVQNTNLKKIKNLIGSFQILEERYSSNKYRLKIKVYFNELEIKKFLSEKNISFVLLEETKAIFFPVLYIDDKIKNFDENFFYKNWKKLEIENEIINFILPLDDLDDILKIEKFKNSIDSINVDDLVNKYNVDNYIFALIDYKKEKLNIYLKAEFNKNMITKNIIYDLDKINNNEKLIKILKDLKLKIIDMWKEENLINLLMPLSIDLKFNHKNVGELYKINNVFSKVDIIENYSLEEFDVDNSLFKIYYFGNPKKLTSELIKFGYKLNFDQGYWQVYLNE